MEHRTRRGRHNSRRRMLTVLEKRHLTPTMLRIVLGGEHFRIVRRRGLCALQIGRDLHFLTPFSDTQLAAQFGGDYASGKPRWQSKGKAMHSASIPMNLGVDDLADGSLAQRPDEDLLRIETHHRLMNTFAILGSFLQQERNTANPSRRMALTRSVRMIVAHSRLHRCLALVTQRRQVGLGEYVAELSRCLSEAVLEPMGISCEVKTDDGFMAADHAERLRLVLCELVINAACTSPMRRSGRSRSTTS